MQKKYKRSLTVLVFLMMFMLGINGYAAALEKPFNVSINTVNVKVNGKAVKIDNFSYLGKVFLQPQDISSILNIGYTYDNKAKTVNISNKKPQKPIKQGNAKFSSIKATTIKSLKMKINSLIIKVDGNAVKIDNFIYEDIVFVYAKDLAQAIGRESLLDTKSKTFSINEKKPTSPVIAPNTLKKTNENVIITISGWGNAVKKEYSINDGPWQVYKAPVVMSGNGIISARGTNAAGINSDISSMEIDNVLTLLNKVQVADLKKSVVKVISYNKFNNELGTGSGFYISEDGNVVTNYHVIDFASYLAIEDYLGKRYDVSGVLDYSVEKDLAVLKVKGIIDCNYLSLGDSDKLVYGEDVVAIGYPLGMPVNVTFGNIGSLNIDGVLTREKYKDIQISTPISSGNSGGPLLNMYGEVIGINYANSDGNHIQNLNRSIPANDLNTMINSTNSKSIKDVINEVYSKDSLKDFSDRVYYDYYTYKQGDYEFRLDYVNTIEKKDEANKIYGILVQTPESYSTVLEAEGKSRKQDIESWIKIVFEEYKAKYPGRDIELQLAYLEYSKVLPNAIDTSDYFFDKDEGEWAIRRYKLAYYQDHGDYKFYYWN